MSERIIIARHKLSCDLCGGIIHAGEKCRMTRDDFQCGIVRFEHIQCPGSPAVAIAENNPKPPKTTHKNAICFA